MTRCLNHGQSVIKTDDTGVERESRDYSKLEDEKNGERFGTEAKEVPPVEGPGGWERDMPTIEKVPNCFWSLHRVHCTW